MTTSATELKPFYSTPLGRAYLADSLQILPTFADGSINLIFTSPPYALHFKKRVWQCRTGPICQLVLAIRP